MVSSRVKGLLGIITVLLVLVALTWMSLKGDVIQAVAYYFITGGVIGVATFISIWIETGDKPVIEALALSLLWLPALLFISLDNFKGDR